MAHSVKSQRRFSTTLEVLGTSEQAEEVPPMLGRVLKMTAAEDDLKVDPDWPYRRQVIAKLVTSDFFLGVMGVVIMLNTVLMLIETDLRANCDDPKSSECPANGIFITLPDRICFIIYVMELAMRLYAYQNRFCYSMWNIIDAMVVVMALVGELVQNSIQNAALIRLIRIFRVVRVLRVMTLFHELYLMLTSLASTMRTIFWACVMLCIVLSILSLVAVELLNPLQKQMAAESDDDCERCSVAFSSIKRSMVTFFYTIIMGDGIADVFVPLIERDITAAVFIVLSVAIVYLGFSNLVLSVIVEKGQEARAQDTTYQAILAKKIKDQARKELLKLWEQLDEDGSNSLTLMELTQQYEKSENFRDYFKSMDIDLPFLRYAFTVMDPDGDGKCSFQDFAETVVHLKSTAPGPAVAFVRHQMAQVVADVSDIKNILSETKNKSHELEVASVPLATISAAGGGSSTSSCRHPREPELPEGDQKIENLQNTLHEWEEAISEAEDDRDTQSGQPCNVEEQPPEPPFQTAEPEKPAPKLQPPPWRRPVEQPVLQPRQAEDLLELLRNANEGPTHSRARVLSAASAASSSYTSRWRDPRKLEPAEGDLMAQTLQDKLHEWEAASSEALYDSDTQSRQPGNVVEQPPVLFLQTAGPEKHTRLPQRSGQAGPVATPVTQSRREGPRDAAEDVVELLRYVYEGPRPMNLHHLQGLEYHFADLCQRVEVQLGRLLRLDPDAPARSRLELFACSARLMGALGTAMPGLLRSSIGSPQQLRRHAQQNGHGDCGLRYSFEL